MAVVKMKNEIDVIFEKLNSFLFLENLGGVVDIEIRPRENGIFLRIIPVEQRRDVWISEGRVVEEAEEEYEDDEDTEDAFESASPRDETSFADTFVQFARDGKSPQATEHRRPKFKDVQTESIETSQSYGINNGDAKSFSWNKKSVGTNHFPSKPVNFPSHDANGGDGKGGGRGGEGAVAAAAAAVARDSEENIDTNESTATSTETYNKSYASEFIAAETSHSKQIHCCTLCPMVFDKKCQMAKHRRLMHPNEQKDTYKTCYCKTCDTHLESFSALMKHWWQVHKEHKCRHCKKTFDDRETLMNHLRKVHNRTMSYQNPDDQLFRCEKCSFKTTSKHSIQGHLRKVHIERNIFCSWCSKAFKLKQSLDVHVKAVHLNERKHNCKLCSKAFATPSILRKHERTRHLYPCSDCELILQTPTLRSEHARNTHGIDIPESETFPCFCTKCPRSLRLNSQEEFDAHVEEHAADREKEESSNLKGKKAVTCPRCPFQSMIKEEIVSHAQTEHDLVPFRCTYDESCTYYTFDNRNVRKHVKDRHLNQSKVYSCKTCSLQFYYKEEYQNHRKNVHDEEDRLEASLRAKCRLCHHQFDNKRTMAMHRKRPHRFDCPQCDLKFVQKHDLKRHAHNDHGEENGYSKANICPLCHRQFPQKCDIYRHQSKLHKWNCPSCELKFVQRKAMWQHVQDQHDSTNNVEMKYVG